MTTDDTNPDKHLRNALKYLKEAKTEKDDYLIYCLINNAVRQINEYRKIMKGKPQ